MSDHDPVARVLGPGDFPFSPRTHDQGWAWMYDLAVVGSLLEARPGDRILDLGAGAGFATEMLLRFGYRVVSLDPDAGALGFHRARLDLDPRVDAGQARRVQAVAQALPFADASFDGAIGLNMVHHVDDLEGFVAELSRVLRPGARAAFSEPGTRHLEAPVTRRVMRELGEDDKPFDVQVLAALAWPRGFSRVDLYPGPPVTLTRVEVRELEDYAEGIHFNPWTHNEEMQTFMTEYHPIFRLVREGTRREGSRSPRGLAARLEVGASPPRLRAGEAFEVDFRAENVGPFTWDAGALDQLGTVRLGVKLLRANGRLVDDSLGATPLGVEVAPGGAAEARATVRLPADLEPGSYRLAFDLVSEHVCWFADVDERAPDERPVEVLAAS